MIETILAKYGMTASHPRGVPLTPSVQLCEVGEPADPNFTYGSLVGSLLFVALCTRPDIAFAVGVLARYLAKPTAVHVMAAKGVLRYLAGTKGYALVYGRSSKPKTLLGYSDSDYGGDTDTRRSTTGYVFVLNGAAITWQSKCQPTVAVSTTEAEYMAAASAIKEALWLRKLATNLDLTTGPVTIMLDNQSTIKVLRNPVCSTRSKHIDMLYAFARERVTVAPRATVLLPRN